MKDDVEHVIRTFSKPAIQESLLGIFSSTTASVEDEEVSSDGEDDSPRDCSHTPGYASQSCMPITRSVPVSKWGVSFSGEGGLSLGAFLERVNELREARGVSFQELFLSAVDLFTGKALIWFRANRRRAIDWHSLVRLLREEFQSPHYDEQLLAEIRSRTQGNSESVGIYLASMEGMFERLSVKIPPPSRKSKLLEPDLACMDVAEELAVMRIDASSTSRENKIFRCFRCNEKGHRYADCKKASLLKCYGCGKPGVIRPKCPKCNPSNPKSSGGATANH